MKTFLLKTEAGIALEIDGVVSECTLDYSEEVAKWIADKWGIVDMEDLAKKSYCNLVMHIFKYEGLVDGFKDGVKYMQSLSSEKQFTREDIEKAIHYGKMQYNEIKGNYLVDEKERNFISYLRPNRVECTVEMDGLTEEVGDNYSLKLIPKIVDNTIRVLTIKT